MVFVDTNIFMYAAGSQHKNKIPCLKFLHDVAGRKIEACTNVEVLQEILHRYRNINRWDDGQEVYKLTCSIISNIKSIDRQMLDTCLEIMNSYPGMIARDSLHIGFCINSGIEKICSYDKDFNNIKEIKRIEPDSV